MTALITQGIDENTIALWIVGLALWGVALSLAWMAVLLWRCVPELIRRWQWWQITRQAVRRRRMLDRQWAKELREIERQLNAPAMQRDREVATWRKHW